MPNTDWLGYCHYNSPFTYKQPNMEVKKRPLNGSVKQKPLTLIVLLFSLYWWSSIILFFSSSPRQMKKLCILGELLDACIWCATELETGYCWYDGVPTTLTTIWKHLLRHLPKLQPYAAKVLEGEHIVYHNHDADLDSSETDILRQINGQSVHISFHIGLQLDMTGWLTIMR